MGGLFGGLGLEEMRVEGKLILKGVTERVKGLLNWGGGSLLRCVELITAAKELVKVDLNLH